jgi:hypothetical protein
MRFLTSSIARRSCAPMKFRSAGISLETQRSLPVAFRGGDRGIGRAYGESLRGSSVRDLHQPLEKWPHVRDLLGSRESDRPAEL